MCRRACRSLGVPSCQPHELNALLPIALAAFVLAAVESSAIGRMFGQKHGHRFDANQELLAIGAANLAAGIGRGFPVSGGMSQSLVNESAGRAHAAVGPGRRRSSRSFVVLFASGLLRNLPQPVLAAIVLAAVMSLVDVHALRHIWRFSRGEFFVAIAALVGVLGSGPVNGVLLGAAISIVLLLRQASRPRVTELTRVPGTTYYADRSRQPDNERTPGVLVVRCESALLYFNVEFVRERLFELLNVRTDAVRLVVFFMGAVPRIDLAGAELLADLHKTLPRSRASSSGWPKCTARSERRSGGSASNRSTVRSNRDKPSISSCLTGRRRRGRRTAARRREVESMASRERHRDSRERHAARARAVGAGGAR